MTSPLAAPCPPTCLPTQNLLEQIGKLERNEPIFAPPAGQQQQQQQYGGGGGYGGGQGQWGAQPQQGQWGGGQQQHKPTTPGGAQQVRWPHAAGLTAGQGCVCCSVREACPALLLAVVRPSAHL